MAFSPLFLPGHFAHGLPFWFFFFSENYLPDLAASLFAYWPFAIGMPIWPFEICPQVACGSPACPFAAVAYVTFFCPRVAYLTFCPRATYLSRFAFVLSNRAMVCSAKSKCEGRFPVCLFVKYVVIPSGVGSCPGPIYTYLHLFTPGPIYTRNVYSTTEAMCLLKCSLYGMIMLLCLSIWLHSSVKLFFTR